MVAGSGTLLGIGGGMVSDPHPRRWVYFGLAILFVLIGVAVFLAIVFPTQVGRSGLTSIPWWPFGLFWGFLWLFFALWFIGWIFRWSWWGGPGWGRYGRYRRWYGHDSAADIARERYARGEISREQFDQIMGDLEQRPGNG